jgi:hypothetical protein
LTLGGTYARMTTMKELYSKIFLCATHRRFKRLFDKIENEGYRLFMRGDVTNPKYAMQVRKYFKNLGNAIALYDKFTK